MKTLQYLGLVSILAVSGLTFAQLPTQDEEDEVQTDGVLSFIEDGPALGSDEGIYRQTPFVEVIHEPGFQECVDQGFDQAECPEFEWSLPFIPGTAATDAEQVVAYEWFRFELRAKHRIDLETGAGLPIVTCLLGGFDIFWLIFEGTPFFPADEFCDGKGVEIIPKCFFDCDLNILESVCPMPKASCAPCIDKGLRAGMEHAMTTYYPEYQQAVYERAVLPLVALGGITWSSSPLVTDGALIAPVADPTEFPNLLLDVAEILIADGVEIDPRAAVYYTQTAALDEGCRRMLIAGTTLGLIPLPNEMEMSGTAPGLFKLEMHKRELASRESAGDTWRRTPTMITSFDGDQIYPRYAKSDGPLQNFFSGEESRLGTGLPGQAACLGLTTFFQMFQKTEVVIPYYHPIIRRATCWLPDFPPLPSVTYAPLVPRLMVLTGPRWHTDWVTVPEGYHIPRAEGEPDVSLRP